MKKKIGYLLITFMMLMFNITSLNASSINFKTSASTSKVVIGKTFNVTVKLSSSAILGSWEYVIDYNSSVLSLVSGDRSVVGYGKGNQKTVSYNYTFKAISSGSSNISVKSYSAFDWDEHVMGTSVSGTSVKVITQAELEASYSKDNNLSSLSIDGFALTPEFNKDVLEYKATLNPNTTSINISGGASDRKASISGLGSHEVTEGENKFEIVVTAENGSTKTYTIIAEVVDPNPIKIKTKDGKELTIVKRSSIITPPENYEESKITINEVEVPSYVNQTNNLVLIPLKDEKGEISFYVYNDKENSYTKYSELRTNNLILYILLPEEETKYGYNKSTIKINDQEITGYVYKNNSNFAIIYAKDIETGKDGYYMYDKKNNSAISYNGELIEDLNKEIDKYKIVIMALLGESFIFFLIFIILMIKKIKKNNRKKEKFFEEEKDDSKELTKKEKKKAKEAKKQKKNKEKIKEDEEKNQTNN